MKDAKLMILGALPFFLIPAALLASVKIDPVWMALSPVERSLLNYTPEEDRVTGLKTDKEPEEAFVGGAEIFEFKKKTGARAEAMPEDRGTTVKKDGSGKKGGDGLTLLVLNGERSMAVINGAVVRRGETVEGMTVKRIEKDRVLVLDKNLRWIYMEGER